MTHKVPQCPYVLMDGVCKLQQVGVREKVTHTRRHRAWATEITLGEACRHAAILRARDMHSHKHLKRAIFFFFNYQKERT